MVVLRTFFLQPKAMAQAMIKTLRKINGTVLVSVARMHGDDGEGLVAYSA